MSKWEVPQSLSVLGESQTRPKHPSSFSVDKDFSRGMRSCDNWGPCFICHPISWEGVKGTWSPWMLEPSLWGNAQTSSSLASQLYDPGNWVPKIEWINLEQWALQAPRHSFCLSVFSNKQFNDSDFCNTSTLTLCNSSQTLLCNLTASTWQVGRLKSKTNPHDHN